MIKLDSLIPFFFAMTYFVSDFGNFKSNWTIEEHVRIMTGICISFFYIVKTIRVFESKSELKEIKDRIDKIENDIKEKNAKT